MCGNEGVALDRGLNTGYTSVSHACMQCNVAWNFIPGSTAVRVVHT